MMYRINCFIEECRFNNNMKCNAPRVQVKLGGTRSTRAADRAFCQHFRPVP
ncbi:DUF1540 domain-containing protein [Desulfallas sp. Bu1-1]|uniref:DUF1540 domain-containing protein n=1 Tax=Desulfallas sp. Bu1-1 TaxID=2787620 RepID=UPI0037BE3BA5